jgi:riboflavin biosynthesis pyrimidine reductase
MKKRERPYVICHMGPSIDGRIVTKGWPGMKTLSAEYERTAQTFGADAWIVGRVSMQPIAGNARVPRGKVHPRIPRVDFVADSNAKSYAIAIDPSGKIAWQSGDIDGEHAITVLSEKVPNDYLAFLRARGVSYLFGGKREINLSRVLKKLRGMFGIRTLLLEGGGAINGSFLSAGLVDELSLLLTPVADGSVGTASLFDVSGRPGPKRALRLISDKKLRGNIVWLRYKVRD